MLADLKTPNPAKLCTLSLVLIHLVLEAVTIFITCLTQTRTCYNTNIFKNLLNQRYLLDSGEKRGKQREKVGSQVMVLPKQLYKSTKTLSFIMTVYLYIIQLKYFSYVTFTFKKKIVYFLTELYFWVLLVVWPCYCWSHIQYSLSCYRQVW